MKISTEEDKVKVLRRRETWNGISVGKRKNDEATDDEVVTIFVREKKPKKGIPCNEIVPNKIDKMRTDVISLEGDVVAQNSGGLGLNERCRPVLSGCCIGNISGSGIGSCGALFRDEPFIGKFYGSSNSHVLLPEPSKSLREQDNLMISQPWHPQSDLLVGKVVNATKIVPGETAHSDAGLWEFTKAEDASPEFIRWSFDNTKCVPTRVRVLKVGEVGSLTSWKYLGTGKKRFEDAALKVKYAAGESIVAGVDIFEKMSLPGTSGSTITSADFEDISHLAFAGSPAATVAIPFDRAFTRFGKVPVLRDWWDTYKSAGPDDRSDVENLCDKLIDFLNDVIALLKKTFT